MPRDRVTPEARITGATLGDLCDRERVVKDRNPPSLAAWTKLAMVIHVLRDDALDRDADRRRLLQLLSKVDDEIDRQLDELRILASVGPVNPLVDYSRRVGGAVAALEQLYAGIKAVRGEAFFQAREPIARPGRGGTKWHGYAGILATHFADAMNEANPSVEIGLSDKGPVSSFLVVVIPLVTGEHPKKPAVVRYLQRKQGQ